MATLAMQILWLPPSPLEAYQKKVWPSPHHCTSSPVRLQNAAAQLRPCPWCLVLGASPLESSHEAAPRVAASVRSALCNSRC
ncbi:hypothetical protein BJX63DRAFT_322436 [Aspergillus granulosus]|uniref:Uncharacterized protein n=1 Tax=Aspergillus granulosus TaxID=176169 RepID=A0ABR4H4L7_9EURO